jgi:DNA-binding FadR family transcriptional regulator
MRAMARGHEIATQRMLEQIVSGAIGPGEQLPSERGLAEQHGISRGMLRTSVEALRERGLVEVRWGKGQWVLPESDWNLLDLRVISAVVAAGRTDLLAEVLECRRMIAPVAASNAAERATEEDLERIDSALASMHESARAERHESPLEDPLVKAEIAAHRALWAAAHNRPLALMLERVDTALAVTRHAAIRGRPDWLLVQVGRLAAALRAHDADAAAEAARDAVRELDDRLAQIRSRSR